ncbi:hypothetical protein PMAYCL1PPCAC_05721, partial [Pristionchus mayeri]
SLIYFYSILKICSGANTVLVSYIPLVSSQADRIKAYAIFNGAEVVAIILGPAIQVACAAFPGEFQLGISWLKASQFTIPIWICLLVSLANFAIVLFFFEEAPADRNQSKVR